MYQDGWTSKGHEYFNTICKEIWDMMVAEDLWLMLKTHWTTYIKKYHKFSYVHNESLTGLGEDCANTSDQENDDDDCVVSLPGEDVETEINNGSIMSMSVKEENNPRLRKWQQIEAV